MRSQLLLQLVVVLVASPRGVSSYKFNAGVDLRKYVFTKIEKAASCSAYSGFAACFFNDCQRRDH